MAQYDVLRISRELAEIQKGTDLSIAVAYQESDLRQVRALIIGPPGTPYEYGFFEFDVKFGPEYPLKPPQVTAQTTNAGRCRFNPNIYASGKVCLSILGTWEGEKGEQWSSVQGLESVLLSIQSLMSNNPYENEPGFEDSKAEKDKELREAYCAKIRHETLRIAVIQRLESVLQCQADGSDTQDEKSETSFYSASDDEISKKQRRPQPSKAPLQEQLNDLLKRRFLWYYNIYQEAILEDAAKHADGRPFERMPFENNSNGMIGNFQYKNLEERLVQVKEKIRRETEGWAMEGLETVAQESNVGYNMQTQFDQFASYQKQRGIHNIDVQLHEKNPFVWLITYFGRSGSNLDGGMFRIKISLSPKFPEEQPRVFVETKLFHHRVSEDGVLCYFPERSDEIKYHIVAIVMAIEEVSPPYDPRAVVNPEATRLFWGDEGDKKKYSRCQRRSAQDSMEECLT